MPAVDEGAAGIRLCGSLSRWAVSLGAAMHNAGYRALGLSWHYVPFEIDDLAGALSGMRTLNIRGFGISMPFKREIMGLLDAIDPLAQRIGAVNTVVNDDGKLTGHNTDWIGAARALEERAPLQDAKVLMLGAGGAARAVAFGLLERGAALHLSNRSDEAGRALADELGAGYRPWQQRNEPGEWSVIINASSAGMSGVDASSPLDERALSRDKVVMDIVYKPLETELLALARQVGAPTIHGGRMLLHQAARQFELYTAQQAPLEAMDQALRAAIG